MTRRRVIALATILLVGSLGAAKVGAQRRPLPPGAALLGQVVDAGTRRGLDRAVVELQGNGVRRRLVTDHRGRFLFTGLVAGEYRVRADRSGYLTGSFGQRRAGGSETVIAVTTGQWLNQVDVPLWRPAVVTGIVNDDQGEPIAGVTVRAYRQEHLPGRTALREVARAETDDTGSYRLVSLTAGDHIVGVSTQLNTSPDMVFPAQYFPNAESVAGASIVTAEAGREFAAVNFMLPTGPTFAIAGRVDPSRLPADRLASTRLALARPADPLVVEAPEHRVIAVTAPDADGRFHFGGVPRGHYVIEATTPPSVAAEPDAEIDAIPVTLPPETYWAAHTVSVTREDQTDIIITLLPGLDMVGRAPAGLQIDFEPLFATHAARPVSAKADETGVFHTGPIMLPGRYLVRVSGLAAGQMLRSVMVGGVDVSDEPLDLSSGYAPSDMVVEVTGQLTRLIGMVRGTGPFADPTAAVLLFPQRDPPTAARRYHSVRAGGDGSFSFSNIPPGAYLIAAIDDAYSENWQTPERLRALRSRATPVILREGEAKVLELRRLSPR